MKKQISIIVVGLMVFTTLLSQNKKSMNYKESWRKVEDYSRRSLPKSASKEVGKIMRMAIADKNSPQVIKALIHQGTYDLEIDSDNNTQIFSTLNDMLAKSKDSIEQSVLHSMLGDLYMQYYQNSSRTINQRTDLGDLMPDDMKEWTKNIFYHKAIEHMNASVNAETHLLNTKVEDYGVVIELEKSSRKYYPTMYDFLSQRRIKVFKSISYKNDISLILRSKKIDIKSLFSDNEAFVTINFAPSIDEYGLWTLEAYKDFIISLMNRGMDESILLTELDRIDYLDEFPSYYEKHALTLMTQMLNKWSDNPLSVEIVDDMTDFMQNYKNLDEYDQIANDDNNRNRDIYNLLKEYIAKYPKYERIGLLKNKMEELTKPVYSIVGNNTFTINGEKKIKISYRNLSKADFKLYKVNSAADVLMDRYNYDKKIISKSTFVENISVALPSSEEYSFNEYEFIINIDKSGIFMLSNANGGGSENNRSSNFIFSVTDLAVFSRYLDKDEYEFFVVDRMTGKPIEGVSLELFKLPGNWNNSTIVKEKSIITNNIGYVKYKKDIPNYDVFYNAKIDGSSTMLNRLPNASFYRFPESSEIRESVSIFTDRSIYRPGQTVYFKAIATLKNGSTAKLQTNKKYDLVLKDANGREISKESLSVNEFGSMSGEFVLPTDAMNGRFYIETANGNVFFRVEEYKRPTFDVEFEKVSKTYTFGEEVKVKGKAESFSGIKLQDATVEYRITRSQFMWRMWGGSPVQVDHGIVTTNDDGEFDITFTPEKPDNVNNRFNPIYSYTIHATVTDLNSETQSSEYNLVVGDVSMILTLNIDDKLEKSSTNKIEIIATNLDGEKISTKGTYVIYSLHDNDSINKQVGSGDFEVGEQKKLKSELVQLVSGKYKIEIKSKDDNGREVKSDKNITLFSYDDKRPPINTNEWFVIKNSTFSNNSVGEVILGATDKVNVLYELWQENNFIERKWIEIDNENRLFSIPYKESFKNGITLTFNYVKDEKFYSHSVNLLLEEKKTDLNVALDVFRDKIRPGTKEEWRISVKDNDGNPTIAEVLASMYDLSLDKIQVAPDWSFMPVSKGYYWFRISLSKDNSNSTQSSYWEDTYKYIEVPPLTFDRFNWFDFSFQERFMIRGTRFAFQQRKATFNAPAPVNGEMELQSRSDLQLEEVATDGTMGENVVTAFGLSDNSNKSSTSEGIRRNFNETAFFYPQLVTNDKGETQILFTVPDSNTKWKFRLLAHDKNLNVGQAEAITQSQKELMVTPNMPRFVRQGDKTSISTKISNLSDDIISGTVSIEFFNPVNDELVYIEVDSNEQDFTIAKDASTDASWLFDVPSDIDIIGVRIVAKSDNFSDGEQHALAVLPNRMLVTESIRMDVNGNQDKSFVFDRLVNDKSETRTDYRLTLEFTTNPAWYAVQALPVLSTPDNDNSVSWFAAYYANKLGAHIAKAYPKVGAMVSAWKNKGGTAKSLMSNLEKNEELKGVLLEETPWVLEANSETEQMQKLSLLFDLNRNSNITNQSVQKLTQLQNYEGGWSWFEGFRASPGITNYILYGFSQLKDLGIDMEEPVSSMISKAIAYLDSEALARFERMKQFDKSWSKMEYLSTYELEYIYVRSLYADHKQSKDISAMISFYETVVTNNWTKYSLYNRSLIAMIAKNKGLKKVQQNIIASYREHATINEDMGMYWANNRAQVFMSQSAVSVHTFIMQAFKDAGATNEEMDNMKRWLLKQKQTQQWESTHATIDAIYALLSTGSDWFTTDGETTITVGNIAVDNSSKEVGTGYIKESWNRTEITPQMGNVNISQKGNTPAWGALYLQYFEDLDKIDSSDASLNVNKQLFVEKTDSSGKKLVSVAESLKVGDKVVVRITVRTDRAMEFVHIKDMRPSCFEPIDQLSGVKWSEGVIYYQSPKDASTNYFIEVLPRGTYVFEYAVVVNRVGEYSNGITTIQSMYAPEFTSHTSGARINVK